MHAPQQKMLSDLLYKCTVYTVYGDTTGIEPNSLYWKWNRNVVDLDQPDSEIITQIKIGSGPDHFFYQKGYSQLNKIIKTGS